MTSSGSLVVVTFKIQASPGKQQELLQALDELRPVIGSEVGCRQVTVSQPKSQKDRVIVNEKWATHKDALRHFRSEPFLVLRGATSVLAQSLKMTISIELQTTSVDLKSLKSRKGIYLWAAQTLS